MLRIFNYILIIFLYSFNAALAESVNVFDFTEDELSTLKVRKVRGADKKTHYSLGNNENGKFIRAEANNSASGLGKEIKINLNETPFLNITWKIEYIRNWFLLRCFSICICKIFQKFKYLLP